MLLNKVSLCTILVSLSLGEFSLNASCIESQNGTLNGDSLFVIVNKVKQNQLRHNWRPNDLLPLPKNIISPKAHSTQYLRKEALESLLFMLKKAKQEDINIYVHSAYRSFEEQCQTYAGKVSKWTKKFNSKQKGLDYASKSSAEPGRSQHQLGTTVDLVLNSMDFKFAFAMDKAPEMEWLNNNAHEFGYILSYSWADDDHDGLGYNSRTGYFYEPWHWRYIGAEAATTFKNSGLLPDDFFLSLGE